MRTSPISSFGAFELTPEEELAGYTFNECQMAVLQNLLSSYAEELLLVRLDGAVEGKEEQIRLVNNASKIELLKYLLRQSEVLLEEIAAKKEQEALDQSGQQAQ